MQVPTEPCTIRYWEDSALGRANVRLGGLKPGQARVIAIPLLVMLALGCGGQTGPTRVAVQGEVLLDGIPLSQGMIRFIPEVGVEGPATAAKIENGQFSLRRSEGPVVGLHRVEIEATGYHDFAIDDEQAFAEAFQRQPRSPLGQNPVPAAYNERSELTAEIVEPGPRELRFELSTNASSSVASRHR
jgi:hypothetical protein